MSDNGPENLTLRHLRALDEHLEPISKDMARGFETMSGHLICLTGRVAGLEVRLSAIEAWSTDTTRRLERIERRLDLAEVPSG